MAGWILQELLDYCEFIPIETNRDTMGIWVVYKDPDVKLDTSYLERKADEIIGKGLSEKAKQLDLTMEKEQTRKKGVFGLKLNGRNPKYKLLIDAEHGREHAGAEVIMRMADEWRRGEFLPEIASELAIYAIPMFDAGFPDQQTYSNTYDTYFTDEQQSSVIAEKFDEYNDLFMSIHQSRGKTYDWILPSKTDPLLNGIAKSANKAMKKYRRARTLYEIPSQYKDSANLNGNSAQMCAYREFNVPSMVLELNFKNRRQQIRAPVAGLDGVKAAISALVEYRGKN